MTYLLWRESMGSVVKFCGHFEQISFDSINWIHYASPTFIWNVEVPMLLLHMHGARRSFGGGDQSSTLSMSSRRVHAPQRVNSVISKIIQKGKISENQLPVSNLWGEGKHVPHLYSGWGIVISVPTKEPLASRSYWKSLGTPTLYAYVWDA